MSKNITDFGLDIKVEILESSKIYKLIEELDGQEMEEHFEKHRNCHNEIEYFPFLLNDGRVAVSNGNPKKQDISNRQSEHTNGYVYSSLKGYLYSYRPAYTKKIIQTDFPKLRIAYLGDDNKLYYQSISVEDGEYYTKVYPKSNIIPWNHVWQLEKGKFLYGSYGNYFIFEDESEIKNYFELVIKISRASSKRDQDSEQVFFEPHLYGRNPLGKEFTDNIDLLISRLPKILKYAECNRQSNFEDIEYHINKHLITDEFSDKAFLPLLAFVGERFNKENNTKWMYHYDKYLDFWFPDIEHEGKAKQMYIPLMNYLNSEVKSIHSLREVYQANQRFNRWEF